MKNIYPFLFLLAAGIASCKLKAHTVKAETVNFKITRQTIVITDGKADTINIK